MSAVFFRIGEEDANAAAWLEDNVILGIEVESAEAIDFDRGALAEATVDEPEQGLGARGVVQGLSFDAEGLVGFLGDCSSFLSILYTRRSTRSAAFPYDWRDC
ncbi:MAG: hypothetical protein JOZ48_16875 [Acidobacteriaceae bacterium]|nr:hypothetical protein [Acidobacteriaceae bacterium]